jgi:hypothetical protein
MTVDSSVHVQPTGSRTNSLSIIKPSSFKSNAGADTNGETTKGLSSSRRNSLTNAITPLLNLKDAAISAIRAGPYRSKSSLASDSDSSAQDPPPVPRLPDLSADPNWSAERLPHSVHATGFFGEHVPGSLQRHHTGFTSESSSVSSYQSLKASTNVTTPDSSRPQSERGPSAERGCELTKDAPISPTTAPQGAFVTTKPGKGSPHLTRDDHSSIQNSRSNTPPSADHTVGELWSRSALAMDLDDEPVNGAMTPMGLDASTAALVPAPLEMNPAYSPRRREGRSAGDGTGARHSETPREVLGQMIAAAETAETAATKLQRLLNLPTGSRSNPEPAMHDDSSPSLRHKDHETLSPPPRSKARPRSFALSPSSLTDGFASLPSSPTSPTHSHEQQRPVTSSGAAYLEAARRLAPAAAPPPPLSLRPFHAAKEGPRGPQRLAAATGSPEQAQHQLPLGMEEPIAKVLVQCCSCKFFHDLPSRLYECMSHPDAFVEDRRLGVSGAISTTVNCPWCQHGMSTRCCPGYAAVVHLKQRLH